MTEKAKSTQSAGLPTEPGEVTAQWLGTALSQSYPGLEVLSLEVEDILWGTGTKMLVRCRYNARGKDAGLPERLCIKTGLAEHREAMAFLYRLEARFFAEIAPQLDLRVPRCFYAGWNEGQGVVVMENLHHAGARPLVVQEPLDRTQCEAFLNAFASLHARWWNAPELADDAAFAWLDRHDPLPDGPMGAYGRGQLEPETWARYMQLPRALGMPRPCRDRERMHAALQALRRYGMQGPICVIHADAHLGNMYLDAQGRPGLLDWQSVRRGHWAQDIAYFLISALDPLDRRAWEGDLLRNYLQALSNHGVSDPPTEAEAWEAIRAHICYGLFYWAVNPVEWQAEENNAAVVPRFAWAAVDHDAPPVGPIPA